MPRLREYRWLRWAQHAHAQFLKDKPQIIAVDTETTGVAFHDDVFAATLSWRNAAGEMVNVYLGVEGDDREAVIEILRSMLNTVPAWVAHNFKFDGQKLLLIGATDWDTLEAKTIHDTQMIYALIDENGRKGLKHLASTVLGVDDVIEVEVKSGPNKGTRKRVPREAHILNVARRKLKLTKDDGYHLLPREVIVPYALKDTEFTLRLFETLMPQLRALNDPRLLEIYAERMELTRALLVMEEDGFALDLPYLTETTSDYGVRVMDGWSRIVELTGKDDLNPQSPAQIMEAFAARGVVIDSTAESVLKTVDDELAQALLDFRADSKIHKTYLSALQREHRDGVVHPSFNMVGARTGRFSSGAASNN